jgi:hypothetical protein
LGHFVFSNTLNARYSDFIVFLSAVATVLSFTNLTHDGSATSSNISSNDVTGIVQLGAPFYEEHYSAELGMPKTSNKSFTGNFTGEGILNRNLSVSAEGNVTGTLRDNDTVFLHGVARFVTENEDTAVYSFDAFADYNPDGSSEGIGTAIFDEGATGELSFLSNTLAVYKSLVTSGGNATFLMWHWK